MRPPPPTLVAGAFGMNPKGVPLGDSPGGFTAFVVICVMVVGGALFVLRRMGM